MSKKDNDNNTMTSLPKKWDNILKKYPDVKQELDQMSVEELKKVIVDAEGNIFSTNQSEENDVKLQSAKELAKSLGASYREAKQFQGVKIAYSLLCLQSKGVDIDNRNDE